MDRHSILLLSDIQIKSRFISHNVVHCTSHPTTTISTYYTHYVYKRHFLLAIARHIYTPSSPITVGSSDVNRASNKFSLLS